jgi:hypothetical protein
MNRYMGYIEAHNSNKIDNIVNKNEKIKVLGKIK